MGTQVVGSNSVFATVNFCPLSEVSGETEILRLKNVRI